jgi:hypothetical protein
MKERRNGGSISVRTSANEALTNNRNSWSRTLNSVYIDKIERKTIASDWPRGEGMSRNRAGIRINERLA